MADAAEIENLVTITDTPPGQLLLDRAADEVRSTWSLDTALHGHARDRNPVLDEGWNSYPSARHTIHRLPGKFRSNWARGVAIRGHLLVTTLERVKKWTPSGP